MIEPLLPILIASPNSFSHVGSAINNNQGVNLSLFRSSNANFWSQKYQSPPSIQKFKRNRKTLPLKIFQKPHKVWNKKQSPFSKPGAPWGKIPPFIPGAQRGLVPPPPGGNTPRGPKKKGFPEKFGEKNLAPPLPKSVCKGRGGFSKLFWGEPPQIGAPLF